MKDTQQQHTILDLAAALNLSPATVSRAMNNTSYVKKETKERVMAMAAQLGYRKNTMAAGLRNNKTNTVGLILPQISMYFHAAVATVIQNLLHAEGYQLIIGQSNDDPAMEKDLADAFFSSRVDALLVSCTLHTSDFSHFDIFKTHHVPVLFYDRVPPLSYPAIIIKGDDFNGGYLAGRRLAAAGCKRIAMISGPDTSNLYQDRAAGFLQALKEENLPVYDHLIYSLPLTAEHTLAALELMFSGEKTSNGAFASGKNISASEAAQEEHHRACSTANDIIPTEAAQEEPHKAYSTAKGIIPAQIPQKESHYSTANSIIPAQIPQKDQDSASVTKEKFTPGVTSNEAPDGIFVTSDRNAVTIVAYAREKGIAIPDQLKLIGYSNDPIAAVITPAVTTIAQFPALFAEKLVGTLLTLLRADDTPVADVLPVIIPVELIERSSG